MVGGQEDGCRPATTPRPRSWEKLSRELGAEAHRIAAWRGEFLEGGKASLKGKRAVTDDDRRLRKAERKIGELML